MSELTFLTLVNDQRLYEQSCRSLQDGSEEELRFVQVEPNRHGWNASMGLNRGLESCNTRWVVCAHQDVVFPRSWAKRMAMLVRALPEEVAVVGLVGTRADGRFRGHIVDPNGHCFWGPLPAEVLVLDESVLVVRRDLGIRFDERVPGFHCYGADFCLQVRALGRKALAVDAAVRHLSTGRLDEAYQASASWLLNRWGEGYGYVIPTPAANIQDPARSSPLRRLLYRWRRRQARLARNQVPAHAWVEFDS